MRARRITIYRAQIVININMNQLTAWYVDAPRGGLHETRGDLLPPDRHAPLAAHDARAVLLRVAGVEVVDLLPGQALALAQLHGAQVDVGVAAGRGHEAGVAAARRVDVPPVAVEDATCKNGRERN